MCHPGRVERDTGGDGVGTRRGVSARKRQSRSADQSLRENMRCFSVSVSTRMDMRHFCLRTRK